MVEKYSTFALLAFGIAGLCFAGWIIWTLAMNWLEQRPIAEMRLYNEEFNAWKEENRWCEPWFSNEDFLELYIEVTGLSPFIGDGCCKEAKKFLIKVRGWKSEHIHETWE